MEKESKSWGGARPGAGRRSDGKERRPRSFKLSDDEWYFLKEELKKYRQEKQKAR